MHMLSAVQMRALCARSLELTLMGLRSAMSPSQAQCSPISARTPQTRTAATAAGSSTPYTPRSAEMSLHIVPLCAVMPLSRSWRHEKQRAGCWHWLTCCCGLQADRQYKYQHTSDLITTNSLVFNAFILMQVSHSFLGITALCVSLRSSSCVGAPLQARLSCVCSSSIRSMLGRSTMN